MCHFSKPILNIFNAIYFRDLFHFPFTFPRPTYLRKQRPGEPERITAWQLLRPTALQIDGKLFFQTNFNTQQPEHQEKCCLQFAEHHMRVLPPLMIIYPAGVLAPSATASACTLGSLVGTKGCEWCFQWLAPPRWLINPPASAQQNHFHIHSLERGQPASPESLWLSKLTAWVQTACHPLYLRCGIREVSIWNERKK